MRGEGPGPSARKAAKLMRYLSSGLTVEIDGYIYYLKNDKDTAINWKAVAVNDWSMLELMALADTLEGKVYRDVMNFKKGALYENGQ